MKSLSPALYRRLGRPLACASLLLAATGVASAKDLWLAQVAPFGGTLAKAGRDFNLGVILALNEINVAGGINGQRLRLASRDDGYRTVDTLLHTEDLLAKQLPVAFLGMWGADNIEAVLNSKALQAKGVPVVGINSGMAAFRTSKGLFHIRASYAEEVTRILNQLATMGTTRIAVVYEDEAFGREAWAVAKLILDDRHITPVAVVSQPGNDVDLDQAAQKVAASEPQAVLLVANTPVAAALVSGLRAKGLKSLIFATSTVNAEQLVTQLGTAASGTVIAQGVPSPYRIKTSIARNFNQQAQKLRIDSDKMTFASMEGYVAAQVVAEGLRRSGKDPDGPALARALESMKRVDLGGFWVNFSPENHEGSKYVEMSIVGTDGRIRQ